MWQGEETCNEVCGYREARVWDVYRLLDWIDRVHPFVNTQLLCLLASVPVDWTILDTPPMQHREVLSLVNHEIL